MPDRRLLELPLAPVGRFACDGRLQVRIEHLIGVQLGAVAGQVEHLDMRLVLLQPRLHRLGVVHFQVVQYQEHFGSVLFPGLLHQTLHEVDQDGRIHAPLKALEANLAPVGHAGDDGQAFSALVDPNLWRLAYRGVRAAPHII